MKNKPKKESQRSPSPEASKPQRAAARDGARMPNAKRSQQRVGRPLYVASVKDYRDNSGVRGGIYDLNRPRKHQLIFVVWGSSLAEMRRRKHWLLDTLKKEERPTDKMSNCPEKTL